MAKDMKLNLRTRVEVYAVDTVAHRILAWYPPNRNTPELPGGGVEDNEAILDAAIRETMEESGYTLGRLIYQFPEKYDATFIDADHSDPWMKQNGTDGEITKFVVFELGSFSPDETYKSEGDGYCYNTYSFSDLIELCDRYIKQEPSRVKAFVSQRRRNIKVIESILDSKISTW